jgi:hypothetical protein
MAYTTYSYGSTNQSPFNGNRPPYKIGDYFDFPNIVGRDAPDLVGDAAKPALIRSVSIAVGGYNNSSATSQFGVWDDDGTGGKFSSTFTLPNGGSSTPPKVTRSLTSSKPVFANTQYILGFLKRNTQLVVWGTDTTKSGNTWRDNANSGDSSNFTNSDPYTTGASLVWTIAYDILPAAPTSLLVAPNPAVPTTAVLVWAAPSLATGETPITGYRIQRSTDGGGSWSTIEANTGSVLTTYSDSGLTDGVTYTYRVAAHNEVSTSFGVSYSGPYSANASVLIEDLEPGNTTSTLRIDVNNTGVIPIVFSDAGDGLPYEAIQVTYGSENLFNRVLAAAPDADVSDLQTVDAVSSQEIYGIRSYDIGSSLLNADVSDVVKAANSVLYKSYLPNLRVESISVSDNKLSYEEFLAALAIDIDTVIGVYFTPNGVGDQIQTLGRVIGVSHAIDLESHIVTYRLQSIDSNPFILDSVVFGQLDTNILG